MKLNEVVMRNKKELGMYVHIPFCKQKCNYCDFVSYCNKDYLIEEYMKWLILELKEATGGIELGREYKADEPVEISTIYIGGGTPSYIPSKYIKEMVKTIRKEYPLINRDIETTIEVNPGTVNNEKLQDYFTAGINRLSIGMQAMQNKLLHTLGRIHTVEDFLQTYHIARKIGFSNINIDIMFGLPDQTMADLEETIRKGIELQPEHISLYSLSIEEGTKFDVMEKEGKLNLPSEELERRMYWKAKEILEEAGYVHYEISNFAKEGFFSQHNMDCWNQKEYMGFGVSAHSYTDGMRFSNIESVEEYIENNENEMEENNEIFHEEQTKQSMMKEYMMLGLRKLEGISKEAFFKKFEEDLFILFQKEIGKLEEKELVEIQEENVRLTKKGLDFANVVFAEFI